MITAGQMRAARALLGLDQFAERSGLSLPTIQRMEAGDGLIRLNVSLLKLGRTLAGSSIVLDNAPGLTGGRGARLTS